ncbi:diol dehydratase small subunit [Clostridium estertheticum]|uniref:diol dehydratase small subunit n=1 Tax=Clostridium estertheticum TaxID=238834 RepID=UPI001CD13265|nr:diol dehydratase small subunit [Clostridium estertheticum]MBZ9686045.1 diol dehydratase small subunit [Clostridium estertheticum]
MIKYPLSENMPPELIKSKTGKSLADINISNILDGKITADDIKISKETLIMQGKFASEAGRPQLNDNFVRASELIEVPDAELLEIYEKLRPNRSTKSELLEIARKLKEEYAATHCCKLVLDAMEVYEKRGLLK